MAEIIWSKKIPSYLSPMTTAEEGDPFRWTGGMRRRLSYGERLLQCSLQGDFVGMKFLVNKWKCNIDKVIERHYQGYSCCDDHKFHPHQVQPS